jgi:hypothetical protein
MPIGTGIVRLSGRTGSDRQRAKPSLLTLSEIGVSENGVNRSSRGLARYSLGGYDVRAVRYKNTTPCRSPGGLLRKRNIKQRLGKCGGVVCHAPWGGQPDFPSSEIQAPLGYDTTCYGCHVALAVHDGSS